MKIYPPSQLSKAAGEYYRKICKQWPDLSSTQKDLAAIASEEHETYWAAKNELTNYAAIHHTCTVVSATGVMSPHPAFRIQQQSFANYLKAMRAIATSGTTGVALNEIEEMLETL